jgi:hypothetical protein
VTKFFEFGYKQGQKISQPYKKMAYGFGSSRRLAYLLMVIFLVIT